MSSTVTTTKSSAITTTGPERFAPSEKERTVSEQIAGLCDEEKKCFESLRSKWNDKRPSGQPAMSDELILRFAYCSPGEKKFHEKSSWKVMKHFDATRFLNLRAANLEKQLSSKTLFPVPGLKTAEGDHDVFYMRPSRYFPNETPTDVVIDNLAYCMSCMQEANEKNSKEGIGFVANMNGWTMTNFSVSYCLEFMKALQGKVPARVRMFLIVNPPSWFDAIWTIMKPMLSKDFRKKVSVIPETQLSKYLAEGYEDFLPDEFVDGRVSTDDMVKDFVAYRKSVEQ